MSETSLLGYKWQVLNNDHSSSILERLLSNRGVLSTDFEGEYLNPTFSKLHDPFLMDDMDGAVKRIQNAIKNDERIIIFGDYDVDGVTGTAILVLGLLELGANVSYRLPSRTEDGYGLNDKVIDEIAEVDTQLLITVDTGISCADQIALARKKGIDVIITDHHTIPEQIPEANFILHPKMDKSSYPFADLTGAGVAFKLIQGLFKEHYSISELEAKLSRYIDLSTLCTFADLGPLQG